MKKIIHVLLISISVFIFGCNNNASSEAEAIKLNATEFQQKISETKSPIILDVRTSGEFLGGHIAGAKNLNIRDANFDSELSKLDKNAPLFVYCLSGSRSSYAAAQMKESGFTQVYELAGGVMKWLSAGLPLTTTDTEVAIATEPKSGEITKEEFNTIISSDKFVLIDYYAEWCGPCKAMEPFLDELKTEMADKLIIQRIDVDKNKSFAQEMGIEELPTLQLYKKGKLVWKKIGFMDKEALVNAIK